MFNKNVVIIGSGPAGLTAALYAARANLEPVVITGPEPGGQLTTTTEVENFPGFPEGIQGPELMEKMKKQAEKFGAQFINGSADEINLKNEPFEVKVEATVYKAKSVIIASGASAKWLGLPNEQKLIGKGISSCATCDGFFFRDKDIIVVGGGDSAMEEATFLTKFAKSVTIVHRRDKLSASVIMQEKAKKDPKINFMLNHIVKEYVGEDSLKAVKLQNVETEEIVEKLINGVFVAIGHKPNTDIFKDQLELDEKGYLKVKDHTKTKTEGVFVAGDVHDYHYRQAVTAAGFGCMAAMDAIKWLDAKK